MGIGTQPSADRVIRLPGFSRARSRDCRPGIQAPYDCIDSSIHTYWRVVLPKFCCRVQPPRLTGLHKRVAPTEVYFPFLADTGELLLEHPGLSRAPNTSATADPAAPEPRDRRTSVTSSTAPAPSPHPAKTVAPSVSTRLASRSGTPEPPTTPKCHRCPETAYVHS